MIKAIIATSIFAALAAIVFKSGDFGAIPTKAACMKYKKRCPHHTGRRFTYPNKWEENGLSLPYDIEKEIAVIEKSNFLIKSVVFK